MFFSYFCLVFILYQSVVFEYFRYLFIYEFEMVFKKGLVFPITFVHMWLYSVSFYFVCVCSLFFFFHSKWTSNFGSLVLSVLSIYYIYKCYPSHHTHLMRLYTYTFIVCWKKCINQCVCVCVVCGFWCALSVSQFTGILAPPGDLHNFRIDLKRRSGTKRTTTTTTTTTRRQGLIYCASAKFLRQLFFRMVFVV